MRKFKKVTAATVSIFMVLSMLTGCGSSSKKESDTANSSDAVKKIKEISYLVWDRGTVPADQGTIEDNWWTKYVNEKVAKLGIKVKFIPIPRAQESQKLPTMLAAGEAPDICYSYDTALLNTYVKNGALTDFTDLFDKYGTNIKKVFSQKDIDIGKINGKLYSFKYKTMSVADTTWIRKDWLDKLGMKEPTNLTEFYNMLKAFKEKDPGKVGDKLVPFAFPGDANYPFGIWASICTPAFTSQAPSGDRLFEVMMPMWPETKDTMKFLNKLYNEKLMGEFILDKDGSQFKQKVIRGEIGAFVQFAHWPYHNAYGNILENLQKNTPDAQLTAITPWKDKSQENYVQFVRNQPYGYTFFSPKSAKYPDLVMKYLDWFASDEGNKVAQFGIEGTDYNLADGIPKPIDDTKYQAKVPWVGPQYQSFINPFANDPEKFLKNQAKDFNPKYRDQYIKQTIVGDKVKYYQPPLSESTPITDKNTAPLAKKWVDMQVKILTSSDKDFDKIFDDSIKTYKAEGGDDVAKELGEAYKKQYGK